MQANLVEKIKTIASRAQHSQFRIGAMILVKGIPISFGSNHQTKTHPLMKQYDEHKTIHAELSAILKVKDKTILNGATMVVYREHKNGELANSKPCHACSAILKDFGFKTIIYTNNNKWNIEKI